MRKINNKNINGNFFIENFDEREEQDRVKIYDSDENYLDYLPLEEDDTPIEEQYNNYIEMLENFKTVEELMDWLVCNYEFIGNKSEAIKYVLTEWNLPDDECDPLDSEWVNRIGDTYIIIAEY
jgi:hypothetical protein